MPGHLRGRVTVGLNCAWACVAIALTAVAAALHVDRFAAGPAAADGFSSSHSSSGLSGGAAGTGVDAGLQAWQQLQLLASAPVAALWFVWLLAAPESARFLLLRGRTAEAEQALRDASVTAGTPLPAGYTFPWRRRQQSQHGHPLVQAAYHAEPADQDGQAAKGAALLSPMQVVSRRAFASCTWPPFGLIFTYVSPVLVTKLPMEPPGGGKVVGPPALPAPVWSRRALVGQTAALCLCWFTATLVYYGLAFSAGKLSGGLYVNNAALCAVDIPVT
jgi:hypothetical protein